MATTLNIFPTGILNTPYIGQIKLSDDTSKQSEASTSASTTTKGKAVLNGVLTIALLDVSGSMGQNVNRIVTDYLPNALVSAGYTESDKIHLVTFSDAARIYNWTIADLRHIKQNPEGNTYMSPGIQQVLSIISSTKAKKIRLITISDGQLNDQAETVQTASKLAAYLKSQDCMVASSAIRLYTSSYGQPDTRGLSSLLQLETGLETISDKFIVDINDQNHRTSIIQSISDLLVDKLGNQGRTLVSDKPVFLRTPWSEPSTEISLNQGENTFWLKNVPNESLCIINTDDIKVKTAAKSVSIPIKTGEKLSFESYNTILKEKVDYFLRRLKILKVINTPESQKEVSMIVDHFQQLDKCFERNDPSLANILNNTLKSRLSFFKAICKKKTKSVGLHMAEIANDDKVSQMNSAQQADYLRSADATSNSKALARRAIKQGLSFDSTAIAEVKAMRAHLSELDGIDDSGHYVSFYSQESTLQGIRSVCGLADDDDVIDNMSALEILQLLNIVGIPCIGQVGDFPDPKTYHLEELMLGSFVSMADVITVKQNGDQNRLKDPFSNREIINVVPFYDDDRIQQFLMKYAKTLLEYTASLGMRNMILDIPHTYKYTVVGGLWYISRLLDKEKTALNVDIFMKLVITYKTAVDGLFDYVLQYIREQSDAEKKENKSFYISNNGTTNMISPLITIMEEHASGKNTKRIKYVPAILRALYSFEIYQVIRKFNKSDDDKLAQRKKMLDDLLGINFEKYGTPLPPLFEVQKDPPHHSKPHPNEATLTDLIDRFWWVDNITPLPGYLLNAFKGSPSSAGTGATKGSEEGRTAILKTPSLTPDSCLKALGIDPSDMDLRTFKFYCIIQSFLYDSKAARVDEEPGSHQMLIEDCGNKARMDKMVSTYIEKQYRADYQSRLAQQAQEERNLLAQELVNQMANTDDKQTFINLFKTGINRNHVSVVISDTYQLGFTILRDKLFNPSASVKLREYKLTIFVLGVDKEGKAVWNKGNAIRAMSIGKLNEGFANLGLTKFWEEKLCPVYKEKNIYLYRDSDKPNRHTHCNSKTSFWAYGYPTVGKYFADITEAERHEYMKIHTNCCGIWDGVLVKPS